MEQAISLNNYIENLKSHSIFSAKELHQTLFKQYSFGSFCKALSRLEDENKIERIAKGIYCKPKISSFGLGKIPISEQHIIHHYLGNENLNGIVTGYSLFRSYGLTTQVEKNIIIYSNKITTNIQTIQNVKIFKLNGEMTKEVKLALEFLFIIDNFHKIQDLDYHALLNFFKKICTNITSQNIEDAFKIQKFSKKTIAQTKIILDYFGVTNELNQYLSPVSSYKILKMEDFYEFT